jgi:hypothetical protein
VGDVRDARRKFIKLKRKSVKIESCRKLRVKV